MYWTKLFTGTVLFFITVFPILPYPAFFSPPGDIVIRNFPDSTEAIISRTDKKNLRFVLFTASDLTLFDNAAGIFQDTRWGTAGIGTSAFPGRLSLTGGTSTGIIHMPEYTGYDYHSIGEREKAKLEKRTPNPGEKLKKPSP